MRKLALICSHQDSFAESVSRCQDIEVRITDGNVPDDSECVLISQEYAGEKIYRLIKSVSFKALPVGIAVSDGSDENINTLLDMGADDVIVFPMSQRLLEIRISSLFRIPVSNVIPINFGLFDKIAESDKGRGSFVIQENDFRNIYRFVMRLLERLDKKAQLIIFSVDSRFRGGFKEPDVILDFAGVVQASLRRGDISSLYGSQLAVILIGADTDDGKKVAERLMETYYAHFDDDAYDISYDIKEIDGKN